MRQPSLALAGVILLSALGTRAQAQEEERFDAWAVNLSNLATGANSRVEIVIERWSSDAERDRLITAFKKSQDELLKQLQKIKPRAGYFRFPAQVGWDIMFAREVEGEDGGRQILLATDRRIEYWEARDRPRSFDYPFTLIELRLDKNGEGEGQASVATKITYNEKKNVLELENFASEPVRLQKVQKVN
jgi:hypothetical protein